MDCSENKSVTSFIEIIEDEFGHVNDTIIRRFSFLNQNKLTIQVINYGATITSIKYPDKFDQIQDVLLGFDNFNDYLYNNRFYFGSTIGRVAGVISKAHFKIGKKDYSLTSNYDDDHIHGGGDINSLDRVLWNCYLEEDKLTMSYVSYDNENGYPGDVLILVTFCLDVNNQFFITYRASTTQITPVNLTTNFYFNLAGHDAGTEELHQHVFQFNSDQYVGSDDRGVPTGTIADVGGTKFDFRTGKSILPDDNFNHTFCLNKKDEGMFGGRIYHPSTGRQIELYTNQIGLRFGTANDFPPYPTDDSHNGDSEDNSVLLKKGWVKCPICGYIIKDADFESMVDFMHDKDSHMGEEQEEEWKVQSSSVVIGKGNANYHQHDSFNISTQAYPDAVHRNNFPSVLISPGDVYHHTVKFKFSLCKQEEEGENEEGEEEGVEVEFEEKEVENSEENVFTLQNLYDTLIEENGR